jgi:hypothetical protein
LKGKIKKQIVKRESKILLGAIGTRLTTGVLQKKTTILTKNEDGPRAGIKRTYTSRRANKYDDPDSGDEILAKTLEEKGAI